MIYYDISLEKSKETLMELAAYIDKDKPIYVMIDGKLITIGMKDVDDMKENIKYIDYIPVISTYIDDMKFALDEQRKRDKD